MPVDRGPLTAARPERLRTILSIAALCVGTLAVYGHEVGRTPIYLHHDEVFFGVQAHAIASTGRDTHDRLLPAYFQVYDTMWFQPVIVYVTALFLQVFALSERALRLPSVAIASANVVLMYLIGRRLFPREWLAVCAAVCLALTPAHLIFGRMAIDNLYQVTFVLAWLWVLLVFLERRDAWILFAATTLLGLGRYSYIAANVMMPLYLVMTLAILAAIQARSKLYAVAAVGFAWPLLLSVPFLLQHSEFAVQTLSRYTPRSALQLDPIQQVRELLNYTNLSDHVGLFFSFFNPGYLFLSGGGSPVISTRTAGVFLLPLAIFLPVGLYQACHRRRSPIDVLLVAGFLTAPLAAILVHESEAIDRELVVLPFGVLLAITGVRHLWSAPLGSLRRVYVPLATACIAMAVVYGAWTLLRHGRLSGSTLPLLVGGIAMFAIGVASDRAKEWRVVAACLLAAGAVQFGFFYADYLTDYRVRTAGRFEFNRRGALEEIIARQDPARPRKVYISHSITFGDAYWRFYAAKHGRDDLKDAAVLFDPGALDPGSVAAGTFFVLAPSVSTDIPLSQRSDLELVAEIREPDGSVSFVVLQKRAT